MQLKSFKTFLKDTVEEGNRLQRFDINGKELTKAPFTSMQFMALIISLFSLYFLPTGFSENFAGYIISFLGIFIGLFTSIVISLFDKAKPVLEKQLEKEQQQQYIEQGVEKARFIQLRNYLIQFNGLISYSILIAIIIIILLSISLLDKRSQTSVFKYHFIHSISAIDYVSLIRFIKGLILVLHRLFTVYFLVNFFSITVYSITSYFSYLSSEYKKITFKNND